MRTAEEKERKGKEGGREERKREGQRRRAREAKKTGASGKKE